MIVAKFILFGIISRRCSSILWVSFLVNSVCKLTVCSNLKIGTYRSEGYKSTVEAMVACFLGVINWRVLFLRFLTKGFKPLLIVSKVYLNWELNFSPGFLRIFSQSFKYVIAALSIKDSLFLFHSS